MMNSTRCTEVISKNNLIKPLILKIDNRALTSDEIQDTECSWKEGTDNSSSQLVTLSNHNSLNYEGVTKDNDGMCKTLIVLQNKKSNKVKVVEVGESQLRRMLPIPSTQTNYDNDGIEETFEENREKLLKAFGSKKSNRASDVSSKMQINYNMMSSKIQNTATSVEVSLEEIQQAESSIDTCLPTCHRDAISPDQVYIIEDFLTSNELYSLEEEASAVMELIPFKNTEEKSRYTQFFMKAVNNLQHKANNHRISILLYVDALIKYYNLSLHQCKKIHFIGKFSPWCISLKEKIFRNFTVEDGETARIRDSTMDDKIVVHIIVLVIIACNSCNLRDLQKFLPRISNLRLEQMARALCLSTHDKSSWFVKLPLPPPRSRVKRQKVQ